MDEPLIVSTSSRPGASRLRQMLALAALTIAATSPSVGCLQSDDGGGDDNGAGGSNGGGSGGSGQGGGSGGVGAGLREYGSGEWAIYLREEPGRYCWYIGTVRRACPGSSFVERDSIHSCLDDETSCLAHQPDDEERDSTCYVTTTWETVSGEALHGSCDRRAAYWSDELECLYHRHCNPGPRRDGPVKCVEYECRCPEGDVCPNGGGVVGPDGGSTGDGGGATPTSPDGGTTIPPDAGNEPPEVPVPPGG